MGFGKEGKGVIVGEARSQTLGTLANNTGILIGTKNAMTENYRMLKAEVYARITGVTANELKAGALYLANGDLTLAEVEEAIETGGPFGPSDRVPAEKMMRAVFLVGIIRQGDNAAERVIIDAKTGAPLIQAKPRWTFAPTLSWNWVFYNGGEAPTTGATIRINVKSFGVWVT